jgi:hypothetical protein
MVLGDTMTEILPGLRATHGRPLRNPSHQIALEVHCLATFTKPQPILVDGLAVLFLIALKTGENKILQTMRSAPRIRHFVVDVKRVIKRRFAIEAKISAVPNGES